MILAGFSKVRYYIIKIIKIKIRKVGNLFSYIITNFLIIPTIKYVNKIL